MRARPAAAAVAAVAAVAAALAGCGTATTDLLEFRITGGPGHANERIRVTDDGRASCNGAGLREIPNQTLLDAREVKRHLRPAARHGATFTASRAGGRHYVARSVDGRVAWDEGAPGPVALGGATLLTLRLERLLCRG